MPGMPAGTHMGPPPAKNKSVGDLNVGVHSRLDELERSLRSLQNEVRQNREATNRETHKVFDVLKWLVCDSRARKSLDTESRDEAEGVSALGRGDIIGGRDGRPAEGPASTFGSSGETLASGASSGGLLGDLSSAAEVIQTALRDLERLTRTACTALEIAVGDPPPEGCLAGGCFPSMLPFLPKTEDFFIKGGWHGNSSLVQPSFQQGGVVGPPVAHRAPPPSPECQDMPASDNPESGQISWSWQGLSDQCMSPQAPGSHFTGASAGTHGRVTVLLAGAEPGAVLPPPAQGREVLSSHRPAGGSGVIAMTNRDVPAPTVPGSRVPPGRLSSGGTVSTALLTLAPAPAPATVERAAPPAAAVQGWEVPSAHRPCSGRISNSSPAPAASGAELGALILHTVEGHEVAAAES